MDVLSLLAKQYQQIGAPEEEPSHEHGGDEDSHCGASSGSWYTHAKNKDEQVVEGDVETTHQNVQYAGYLHVTRTFQHRAKETLQLEEWGSTREDEEV